jgi:hypothetical protein
MPRVTRARYGAVVTDVRGRWYRGRDLNLQREAEHYCAQAPGSDQAHCYPVGSFSRALSISRCAFRRPLGAAITAAVSRGRPRSERVHHDAHGGEAHRDFLSSFRDSAIRCRSRKQFPSVELARPRAATDQCGRIRCSRREQGTVLPGRQLHRSTHVLQENQPSRARLLSRHVVVPMSGFGLAPAEYLFICSPGGRPPYIWRR